MKKNLISLLGLLLLNCLCIVQIHAEDVGIELKSGQIQLSDEASALEDIKIDQGQIEINGSGVQARPVSLSETGGVKGSSEIKLEQGTQNSEHRIQSTEPGQGEININAAKPDSIQSVTINEKKSEVKKTPHSNYKGVSISDTGGKAVSSSELKDQPKNMKRVQNLGKPQGEVAKAQSIKSQLKKGESPELNTLEEKRLKRKEAFKKELENREARKALINRQTVNNE